MEKSPALIALDWGTSLLRAFLVGGDGAILDRKAASLGILNVPSNDFERVFTEIAGPWLSMHPALPALASGMIGSRQGWREAPYLACPAGLDGLAHKLVSIERRSTGKLWIVPGVMRDEAHGAPDVMRGEETQILGNLVDDRDPAPHVFVLPGTHSKWVLAEAGRIAWFATFMTGEVYGVLKQHSILGRLMDGEAPDAGAFRQGLARATADGDRLLHNLFSARTLGLFNRLPATGIAAYLSGLLIGTELVEAQESVTAVAGTMPRSVTIIGEPALAKLYGDALAACGIVSRQAPEDAVVRGLWRLAAIAGLLA